MKVDRESSGERTAAIRGTTPEIEKRAKEMRRNLTPAEGMLREAIKGIYFQEIRFLSQHPVGVWILDFYCPKLKLAIEVDGKSHESRSEYDEFRTASLESNGYHFLRFKNEEIFKDLHNVLDRFRSITLQLSEK